MRKKILICILVLCICCVFCGSSIVQQSDNMNFFEEYSYEDTIELKQYQYENYKLNYWLYLPYGVTNGMPLIVFLHGDGEVNHPERLENYGIAKKMHEIYNTKYPFILLMPNTTRQSWTSEPIKSATMSLIEQVVQNYECNKIILVGHSRGALGVWWYISEYNDYFSCAVPIGGISQVSVKNVTIPVRAVYMTGDYHCAGNMRYNIGVIQKNSEESFIEKLSGPHGMGSTTPFTPDMFIWMLEH